MGPLKLLVFFEPNSSITPPFQAPNEGCMLPLLLWMEFRCEIVLAGHVSCRDTVEFRQDLNKEELNCQELHWLVFVWFCSKLTLVLKTVIMDALLTVVVETGRSRWCNIRELSGQRWCTVMWVRYDMFLMRRESESGRTCSVDWSIGAMPEPVESWENTWRLCPWSGKLGVSVQQYF